MSSVVAGSMHTAGTITFESGLLGWARHRLLELAVLVRTYQGPESHSFTALRESRALLTF